MIFEDIIAYFVIFAVFVLAFLPIMSNWALVGQTVSNSYNDTATASIFPMIVPLILICFVIGFGLRMAGRKPFGRW